ncbi:MAG: F0F1 ATP synthase subunit A [Bacteroidota bacterium]
MGKRKTHFNTTLWVYSALILLSFPTFARIDEGTQTGKNEKKDHVMEHISDSYDWHFVTYKGHHYTLHLPVILYKGGDGLHLFSSRRLWDGHHHPIEYRGFRLNAQSKIEAADGSKVYDLSLTKNVVNLLISIVLMFLLFLSMAFYYRRLDLDSPPKGIWALLTYMICFVRDHIAKANIDKKNYERFTPYLLTIFWFIWINNTLGLLPGAANVTGNISTTLVLATFTFLVTNLNGSRDYWAHIFYPPDIPKWIVPMMLPTEILGLFTKNLSLMIRLFANMLAGHFVLLGIIGIMFSVGSLYASAIVLPLGVFMIFLKLFVAFFQAYIFTLLSAIAIGNAVQSHDHDHAERKDQTNNLLTNP